MAQTHHHDEGARAHEALAHAGAHPTHHHEQGTMDITRQEATFATFMRFVSRMVIVIALLLVLLALVNA